MNNPPEDPSASPCIQVCTIDQQGVCEGCHRTLDEIAAYSRLNPQQRQIVNQRAAARRKK
ncbi:hypothetical protein Poly51_03980 [Rubripirellula tenax]|uniref:Fe-S protein n=1 Tax=Rubripirellula tenax TaxID=2528015 RepID=A0A5C6FK39_9BACT|nr:DUF1289 domain-containing protein [Rubripirellula tenax]TWU60124.1 hypothetical protein Poly51_03980 [Rubripirellula tenax]